MEAELPVEAELRVEADLRVVRGDATAEELAALVAVLASRAAAAPAAPAARPTLSWWVGSARAGARYPDGRPVRPGPTAWSAASSRH